MGVDLRDVIVRLRRYLGQAVVAGGYETGDKSVLEQVAGKDGLAKFAMALWPFKDIKAIGQLVVLLTDAADLEGPQAQARSLLRLTHYVRQIEAALAAPTNVKSDLLPCSARTRSTVFVVKASGPNGEPFGESRYFDEAVAQENAERIERVDRHRGVTCQVYNESEGEQ